MYMAVQILDIQDILTLIVICLIPRIVINGDAYVRCINEYVENASNDIKKNKKKKAAQAADDAERKLRFGY